MAKTQIKATAELFLDTSNAKSDAKKFVADLKEKLSSIETAADKMTVFKDLVKYIADVDKALGALKDKHGDAFKTMFEGMDESFRKEFEGLFGLSGKDFGKLTALREQLATLTPKSGIAEIHKFAEALNSLFVMAGKEPVLNLDDFKNTRATQQHIDQLTAALDRFDTVWNDVAAKVKQGFNFGGTGGVASGASGIAKTSDEIKTEVGKLEEQLNRLKKAQQNINQTLSNIGRFDTEGSIYERGKRFSVDDVTKTIRDFKKINDMIQNFNGDISSTKYQSMLPNYLQKATEFRSMYESLRKVNTENYKLFSKLKNKDVTVDGNQTTLGDLMRQLSGDAEEALDSDSDFMNKFASYQKQIEDRINGVTNQISELQKLGTQTDIGVIAGKEQVNQNQQLVMSYERLSKTIREYIELSKQLAKIDSDKQEEEYKTLSGKQQKLTDEIFNLAGSNQTQQDKLGDVFDYLDEGEMSEADALKKICNILQIELPQSVNVAKNAINEAEAHMQSFLQLASTYAEMDYISKDDADKGIAKLGEMKAELIELSEQGKITSQDLEKINQEFDRAEVHLTSMDHSQHVGSGFGDYTESYASEYSYEQERANQLEEDNELIRQDNANLKEQRDNLEKMLAEANKRADQAESQTVKESSNEVMQHQGLFEIIEKIKTAVDEKTAAFEEEGATVDAVVEKEIAALRKLLYELGDVETAIDSKTEAFKSEGTIVDQVVEGEIGSLRELESTIKDIEQALDAAFAERKLNLPEVPTSATTDENIHYVTDPQGRPVTMYRGIRGAYGGLVSNRYHGGTFSTDNLELAKEYAGIMGKVEKVNLSMKNPLEIDGNGANWNQIEYIGDNADEASQKLHKLVGEIRYYQDELKKLENVGPTAAEADLIAKGLMIEEGTKVYQDRQFYTKELNKLLAERDSIYADNSNPYGKKNTNEIVEIAKEKGYDGVIFKNIIDSATGQVEDMSNVMVTFSQDQIHYIETIGSTFESAIDNFTKRFKYFTDNVDVTSDEVRNTIQEMIALKQRVAAGEIGSDEYDKFVSESSIAKDIMQFTGRSKHDSNLFQEALDGDKMSLSFFMEGFNGYIEYMRGELQKVAKAFGMEDMPLSQVLHAEVATGEMQDESIEENSFLHQLSEIQSILGQIYGVLQGFTGIKADNENSAQYKGTSPERQTGVQSLNDSAQALGDAADEIRQTQKSDLVALHGLSTQNLIKALNDGAFPSPSIAVTKPEVYPGGYGEATVVFKKSAIDPANNPANKIYGVDAYTPTYPSLGYELNPEGLIRASERTGIEIDNLRFACDGAYENIQQAVKRLAYNDGIGADLREAFIKERELAINTVEVDERMRERFHMDGGDIHNPVQDILLREGITYDDVLRNDDIRKEYLDAVDKYVSDYNAQYEDLPQVKIKDYIVNAFKDRFNAALSDPEIYALEKEIFEHDQAVLRGERKTIDQGERYREIQKVVTDHSEEYNQYVEDILSDIMVKPNVRGAKGQRFDRTPEGIAAAISSYGGKNALYDEDPFMRRDMDDQLFIIGAAKDYKSIAEVEADAGRLQKDAPGTHTKLDNGYIQGIARAVAQANNIDQQDAFDKITKAVDGNTTAEAIGKALRNSGLTVDDATINKLAVSAQEAANVNTRYFEAKPQRALGLEDIEFVSVPKGANQLMSLLDSKGIKYVEQDPTDNASREAALKEGVQKYGEEDVANAREQLQIEQQITAEKKQQTSVEETDTTNAVEAQREATEMEQLAAQVRDVEAAVQAKTDAFTEEGTEVNRVVTEEIAALDRLISKLVEVNAAVEAKTDAFTAEATAVSDAVTKESAAITKEDENPTKKQRKKTKKKDDNVQLFETESGQLSFIKGVSENVQKAESNMSDLYDDLKRVGNIEGQISMFDSEEIKEAAEATEKQATAEQKLADAAKETADAKQKQAGNLVGEATAKDTSDALRKQLTGAFDKSLGFGLNTVLDPFDALTSERQNIIQLYKKAANQVAELKKNSKTATDIQVADAQRAVKALTDEIKAYKERNNLVNLVKNNTGNTLKATGTYNSLKSQVDSEDFANSNIVQTKFTAYDQAYQKMIGLSKQLAGQDLITPEQAQQFTDAKMACDAYAKDLGKLLTTATKFKDDAMLSRPLDGFVDSQEARKNALREFVQEMYGAKAEIGGFGKNFESLNYTVKNGDGTFTNMVATLNSTRTAINATAKGAGQAKGAWSSFFDEVKAKARSIGTYLISMTGFQEIWQAIRTGVTYVREIDSALTELKKVTNETDATYDAFLQTMSKTAGTIGSTVKDLTNSAADWARLGSVIKPAPLYSNI